MKDRISRLACLPFIFLVFAASVVSAETDLRLLNAVASQDRTAVSALLKEGVDINAVRADGATALLYAVHWDDLETVDRLLRAGAKVNAAEDHGVTALAQACENANVEIVERLLHAGADPNLAQTSGMTPLMTAAMTGRMPIARMLLAHGADVNARTKETGASALMWAVEGRYPEVAGLLIAAHADVHISNAKGLSPLHLAARNGDIEMGKALVAAGAKVNDTGSAGIHPLPFSIWMGQGSFALFLLDQGADPNGEMVGIRALHAAVGNVSRWLAEWRQAVGPIVQGKELTPKQRQPIVKALLARGADPNVRIANSAVFLDFLGYPRRGAFEPYSCGTGNLRGVTPLWLAAERANGQPFSGNSDVPPAADATVEYAEFMRMLLRNGADYRLSPDDGTAPLLVAAGLGHCSNNRKLQRGARSIGAEQAVMVLLEAGADINAVNEADFSALHAAAMRGLNEVIQILVDHGADINARDFKGRTPYRMAEGTKQSFFFQEFPETAEFLQKLGANTGLGIPGLVQERLRDVADVRIIQ